MQVTFGIDCYMQCIILSMIMMVVMTKMLIQTILFKVKSMGAPILNLILGLVLFAALYDFFVTHHGIAYLAHP